VHDPPHPGSLHRPVHDGRQLRRPAGTPDGAVPRHDQAGGLLQPRGYRLRLTGGSLPAAPRPEAMRPGHGPTSIESPVGRGFALFRLWPTGDREIGRSRGHRRATNGSRVAGGLPNRSQLVGTPQELRGPRRAGVNTLDVPFEPPISWQSLMRCQGTTGEGLGADRPLRQGGSAPAGPRAAQYRGHAVGRGRPARPINQTGRTGSGATLVDYAPQQCSRAPGAAGSPTFPITERQADDTSVYRQVLDLLPDSVLVIDHVSMEEILLCPPKH